ncbi:MAG: DUF4296 domain-containing protein [Pseudoflavonifractor sp.]|nr:DUF4296 domain-containing protein [Pseudoflavonifractor sp.]
MRRLLTGISVLVVAALGACDNTPDYVIGRDDMVDLLVDIHTGEGVVEINRREFGRDSLVKVLKQSILLKHGVTQQQFDTSMIWYGHHLDEYLEIYDDVIARLEAGIEEMNVAGGSASVMSVSVAGDSVDVWTSLRQSAYSSRTPSQLLTFAIRRDDNMEPGDVYTWRMKLDNVMSAVGWTVAADYTDGETEFISGVANGNGWNRIVFASDPEREVSRLYGMMRFDPKPQEVYYVDSIELVRTRLDERAVAVRPRYGSVKGLKDSVK